MPLPKQMADRIRELFDDLITVGEALPKETRPRDPDYNSFRAGVESLMQLLWDETRYKRFQDEIFLWEKDRVAHSRLLGTLHGLKRVYESGILDDLSQMIEANVTYDYMSQAEQLLGGRRHQYDHVPAAVLAGAVLENALRSLCLREDPPLEIEENGKPKTLDPLITTLQTGKVITPFKADELRSWAKIRNHAAHGEFDKFTRNNVKPMISSIKTFLAEFM